MGLPLEWGPASQNLAPGGFIRGHCGYLSARATDNWCYRKAHEMGEQQRRMLLDACTTDNACTNSCTGVSNAPSRGPYRGRSDADRAELVWIGFVRAGDHFDN